MASHTRTATAIVIALVAVCSAVPAQTGKTYGAVIGVSRYEDVRGLQWLKYANRDADTIASLLGANLRTAGGSTAPAISVLVDEKATKRSIVETLRVVLTVQPGPQDDVFLFFSARGLKTPDSADGYILGYDGRRERPSTFGITVDELRNLVAKSRARRVFLFADLCRDPTEITQANYINLKLEELKRSNLPLSAILASGPKQLSREQDELRHGVFTYFLNKGLRDKAADANHDGRVNLEELYAYLDTEVRRATRSAQAPLSFGRVAPGTVLQPIAGAIGTHYVLLAASGAPAPGMLAGAQASQEAKPTGPASQLRLQYEKALADRVFDGPQGAIALLKALASELSPEQSSRERIQLAGSLEDAGQRIIGRYGEGDQFPDDPLRPQRRDFERAAELFRNALELRSPDSSDPATPQLRASLEARMLFADGRARMLDGRPDEALQRLERAVQVDPGIAESYNAAGVAYLEQADYDRASDEFKQALRIAPDWAYARHNLALTYIEAGKYGEAEAEYRQAIHRTPYHPYLYYNLGLLLHRLNRKRDAEDAYRTSIDRFRSQAATFSDRAREWEANGVTEEARRARIQETVLRRNEAEAHNALGALRQAEGRRSQAEQEYRASIALNGELTAARYNLAALETESAGGAPRSQKMKEAVAMWQDIVQRDPGYVAARLQLANAYRRSGDFASAAEEFKRVLESHPTLLAAETGFRESRAELYRRDNNPQQACGEYRAAIQNGTDEQTRNRIERHARTVCRDSR